MKRFVILSLCMILSVILFGCDNAKNEIYWSFNTDKAEETALEYMNEKYDKNFYIVSSEKNYDAGYIPTTIQEFWCDVSLAVENSEQSDEYKVRVTLGENTQDYIIQGDTYMTTLIGPWLKGELDKISDNIFNGDFFSICNQISAANSKYGFPPDFPLIKDDDTLDVILSTNDIWGYYIIIMPSSQYTEVVLGTVINRFNEILSGKSIKVEVRIYEDEFYDKYKLSHECGKGIPNGYSQYKILDETFYFDK